MYKLYVPIVWNLMYNLTTCMSPNTSETNFMTLIQWHLWCHTKTDMKRLPYLWQQVPVHLLPSHSEALLHQNGHRTATAYGPTAKNQGALTMWNIPLFVNNRYLYGPVFKKSICGPSFYFSEVHTSSSMVPDSRLPPPSDRSVNTVICWFLALSCNQWRRTCS